jgi:hypothetical protein
MFYDAQMRLFVSGMPPMLRRTMGHLARERVVDQGKDRPTLKLPSQAEQAEVNAWFRGLSKNREQEEVLTPEEVAEALAHGF